MTKAWMRIVIGASIAGGGLAVAGPANATMWRNYLNESKCLASGNNGSMSPGEGLVIWDCNIDQHKPVADQDWGEVAAPFNSSFVELYDTKAPSPAQVGFGDNSPARCMGPTDGDYLNGWQLIIWTCNSATEGHDQGWHPFFQRYDGQGHACYTFTNELAAENPGYSPRLNQVFGVSGANMTNGTPVIMWQYFEDSSGRPTHLDQVWCAY